MDEPTLRRIAMILPLLGSSRESEVLHAAKALNRVLRERGLSYADLAARLTAPPLPQALPPESIPARKSERPTWDREVRLRSGLIDPPRRQKSAWAIDRDDINAVYIRRGELDEWSGTFLESIYEQVTGGRTLSEKQRAKLNEILDRLGA